MVERRKELVIIRFNRKTVLLQAEENAPRYFFFKFFFLEHTKVLKILKYYRAIFHEK